MAGHDGPKYAASPLQSVVLHDFGSQVLLYLPAAVANGERCANNNLLVVEKTHPFFKEMFAAGLSTFQANTKIAGWVHGCNPTFGAPVLIRLDMVR